ncbi:acetyl-CoA carboxylase biotin carboxyl carrier protein [Thermostichus sp. MS-CIW-21]|uniref:acetyl-CoA carboxylase biotin carboxyl carrier protein n=1 Tax=unclassified Synechococcus TaxID=2626047 RepID=UPI0000694369|nr:MULTISPECIES: acetyl-CoA carboxylase biotin carboxyl carrier protein [unclassified Synechococcus]ABC99453.1 acetyl-CoA carboxylase, biotin carboxyl carrier protein [Synechococcus sp. JA-3-3Ab]PIK85227.1 carboxylesterase [Synechococcus sp. 63AY4M2]PIK88480.1 carboxylesterase [Synechococcus sp. 65AY6A5]PIK92911.1 carboxylesterase [Synechococcus sp. 65AY6Li]PIK94264.1 carboxylesterase [Synechococcus sp. 60AY4M2]
MDVVNWQEVRLLLAALQESDVTELILEYKDFRLTLRKGIPAGLAAAAAAPPAAPPPEPPPASPAEAPPPESAPKPAPSHWVEVTAPMVGTFYSAPAPGETDFVQVGQRVNKGQTLCIIEAMKLMNEIEAETAGVVREILVSNGQPVEFGQVLMRLDPTG